MTRAYVLAVLERAVKTFCQTLAALLGVDGLDLLSVDWKQALSAAGLAALLSILTSIASGGFGNDGPSLATEELAPVDGGQAGEAGQADVQLILALALGVVVGLVIAVLL